MADKEYTLRKSKVPGGIGTEFEIAATGLMY
jgi:hypothetical protein